VLLVLLVLLLLLKPLPVSRGAAVSSARQRKDGGRARLPAL
jgi:hypothetical protein